MSCFLLQVSCLLPCFPCYVLTLTHVPACPPRQLFAQHQHQQQYYQQQQYLQQLQWAQAQAQAQQLYRQQQLWQQQQQQLQQQHQQQQHEPAAFLSPSQYGAPQPQAPPSASGAAEGGARTPEYHAPVDASRMSVAAFANALAEDEGGSEPGGSRHSDAAFSSRRSSASEDNTSCGMSDGGLSASSLFPTALSLPGSEGLQEMDRRQWRRFKLLEKFPLSHDAAVFRFGLQPHRKLHCPPVSHIVFRTVDGVTGKKLARAYTPISNREDVGFFDFLVKLYPGGIMTELLFRLEPGQAIEMRGPVAAKLHYKRGMAAHVGLVCGGTGIAPMWQLMDAILRNPKDTTKVK